MKGIKVVNVGSNLEEVTFFLLGCQKKMYQTKKREGLERLILLS